MTGELLRSTCRWVVSAARQNAWVHRAPLRPRVVGSEFKRDRLLAAAKRVIMPRVLVRMRSCLGCGCFAFSLSTGVYCEVEPKFVFRGRILFVPETETETETKPPIQQPKSRIHFFSRILTTIILYPTQILQLITLRL